MSCYDREILSRYQDGSLSESESRRIAAHLDDCSACRREFSALGRAGLFLKLTVGRRRAAECPTDEEIGAYLGGVMRAADRERIEEHLAGCRECLHEVAVLSDDATTEDEAGLQPDDAAMARFRALVPAPAREHRLPAFSPWLVRSSAVAALVTVAVISGWLMTGGVTPPTPGRAMPPVLAADGRPLQYATEASFASTGAWAVPSESAEMARFAGDAGTVLQEIERLSRDAGQERFELAREDLLGSGLLNRVAHAREFAREERDRRFLNDCEYLFLQVVKMDPRDLATPDGDLSRIVSEMRRLKLIETARLVEMEGSSSQWLAGL